MIGIAICDDHKSIHDEVENLLSKYQESRKLECDIYNFFSAQELLASREHYNIILLDIDMPEIDGIQAAEKLNQRGMQYNIIMLTSKRERFKEAFKIGATRFVTKPIDQEELFEALDNAFESCLGFEKITVKYKGNDCVMRQRDIYMIEAQRDYVKIYSKDKIFESSQSLKVFAEQLDKRIFILVHRSYLVNMMHIYDICNDYLELADGKRVPVSRRKSAEVGQKVFDFDVNKR